MALAACMLLGACHQSLDERIKQETDDYTRKECPKRLDECTVLDSLTYTYNDSVKVHACYYSLSGMLDVDSVYESGVIELFRGNVLTDIRTNLQYKRLREHGVTFDYHYYSSTTKGKKYLTLSIGPNEYR